MCHASFLSLEMSSSSCQVILLPLSFFFSVVWLPRPMVIFPALLAPLTIVLDSVLWGGQSRRQFNLLWRVSASSERILQHFQRKCWDLYLFTIIFQMAIWFTPGISFQWGLVNLFTIISASEVAPQTWSRCSSLFALEGLAEVLFVLQQMQRRWR